MRPLPEIRSRSQLNSGSSSGGTSNSNGIDSDSNSNGHRLTNGTSSSRSSLNNKKEPILTRSKSFKLRSTRSRKSSGGGGNLKSPIKAQSPAKNYSSDSSSSNGSNGHRGKDICRTNGVSESASRRLRRKSKGRDGDDSGDEKGPKASPSVGLYARHYKSYRRPGFSSFLSRGRRSSDNFSPPRNCQRSLTSNSKRLRPYENNSSSGRNNSPTSSSCRNSGVSSSFKRGASAIEKRRSLLSKKNNGGGGQEKPKIKKLVSSSASSTTSTVTPLSSPNCSNRVNVDTRNGKDKGGKRRSALWVLNCEAEEFLFGETAADKHELELPPNCADDSPPPKKRRRWRETELKHLLETSPFLESKLRSCSSSSESGRESFNASPPPRRLNQNNLALKSNEREAGRRPAGKGKVQLSFDLEINVKSPPQPPPPVKCSNNNNNSKGVSYPHPLTLPAVISNLELLSPTSSIRSNYSGCREPHSADPKTVHLRETLNSIPWRYSFEEPPTDESWYVTFSRAGDGINSYMSFLSPYFEPVVLPYELNKPFLRSRKKLSKNARKSPRCHASTLAILSSEMPQLSTTTGITIRSTRNSANAEANLTAISPPSITAPILHNQNQNPNPTDSTLESLIINAGSTSAGNSNPNSNNSMLSPFTRFVTEHSGGTRGGLRTRSPSSVKESANSVQTGGKRQDLSAQQYLWDSIQFLSDPYVVSLLAGDEPDAEFPNILHTPNFSINSSVNNCVKSSRSRHSSSYNNNNLNSAGVCPVKKLVQNLNFEALERKASLRSCDMIAGGSGASSGSSGIIPVAKSSPRGSGSGSGTNNMMNHVNGTSVNVNSVNADNLRLLSLNGISKCVENRNNRSPKEKSCAENNNNNRGHNNNSTTNTKSNHSSINNLNSGGGRSSKARGGNFHRSRSPPGPGQGQGQRSKPGSPVTVEIPDNNLNGRSRVSTRKSPIVMVADILRNGGGTTKPAKKLILEEELLFLGDSLPPLPSWPV